MGLFDFAKAALAGNRAYRIHVDANKLAEAGKPAEAKAKFREALRLYGESERLGNTAPNIRHAYALLLMREGEFEKARELMQNMAKDKQLPKGEWFRLRLQYSICLWRMGELDKAMETIGRAAAENMNGSIYGTLGMYWVDKAKATGDFKAALDFNNRALEYDDEDAAVLDNLGQLYEAMADADAEKAEEYLRTAQDFYERAYKARNRQITTLYNLARIYHRNGDDARARELLSVRDTLYFSAICPVTREMLYALAEEIG